MSNFYKEQENNSEEINIVDTEYKAYDNEKDNNIVNIEHKVYDDTEENNDNEEIKSKIDKKEKNNEKENISTEDKKEEKQVNPIDKAEKINKVLKSYKGVIILAIVVFIGLFSFNMLKNLLYTTPEIKEVSKRNEELQANIKILNNENKDLEKCISNITSNNEKKEKELNTIINNSFKAVPGTTWNGRLEYNNESIDPVALQLEIKEEEILLYANGVKWDKLPEGVESFNAKFLMSTGDIDKTRGYMKLNRLNLINPPKDTHRYANDCLPYDYEVIVKDNNITGFAINKDNDFIGRIHLELVK